MAAGESARAEAERARRKIADLERYADTFERGALGEERTAEALDRLGPDWVVFHDLRWPGRRLANIDHVVVGPGGVFVIDSKNWSGSITVRDGVLRQNGYNKETSVASVADAALALASLLGPYATHVHPVLCFVQQEAMRSRAHEVLICSTSNVVDLLTGSATVWTPQQVVATATRLDGQVIAATQPGKGYAPSPRAWVERPRSSTRPADRRPAPGGPIPGTARRQATRQGAAGRTVGALVAALLAGFIGLTMLLAMGGVVVGVLSGMTSSTACTAAAAAAEPPRDGSVKSSARGRARAASAARSEPDVATEC